MNEIEGVSASGSKGNDMKDADSGRGDRVWRVGIHVEAAKDLRRCEGGKIFSHASLQLTVEGISKNTSQIKDRVDEHGLLTINQSFTFDVKDPQKSIVSLKVFGKTFFGSTSLGCYKSAAIASLLDDRPAGSKWYSLFSKDGKKQFPGKVLMQLTVGVAEPEQKIHVFVGTWNVGNAPPANNLSSWIPTSSKIPYEIVAIGSQECDYQPRAPYTDCSKDWIATLKSALGPCYKAIHGLSRGQMRLVVFARADVEKAISEILDGTEATGIGHVMSNKGGICIAFKFWDTSLCFVNCHFAAHEGQCEARNGNYREIVGNIRVNDHKLDILNQFHHVFWLGDLNYRLDFRNSKADLSTNIAWEEVVEQIERKDFQKLLEYDELSKEREQKRVLHTFQEGLITFPPTFKMKRDAEHEYDSKRMPAWCDRILWSSLPGCSVDQLSYTSCFSISSSDHKPVAATFKLTAYALPCNTIDGNFVKEEKRWHLFFTSLRAKDLRVSDLGGSSDPLEDIMFDVAGLASIGTVMIPLPRSCKYVSFIGPNVLNEVQTKVIYQNLNPVWDPAKDLPTIVLNSVPIQRLEKEYIMVRVIDFDYATADDTLGYGAIPLAGAVEAFRNKQNAAAFSIGLSHHGCPAGTLEGEIKLTWKTNVAKRRLAFTKSFSQMSFRRYVKRSFVSKVLT